MKWEIKNNKLTREFDFNNQTQLAEFVLEIAKQADIIDHHPDMTITKCSHLKIELFTHTNNNISILDISLSEGINKLYTKFQNI